MTDADEWQESLRLAERGDAAARDRLFKSLYDELRVLARSELRRSGGNAASIGATTLVHEAYARLAPRGELYFADRGRFMAYVARAMRGLIIDAVRGKRAQKHGGQFHFTQIDERLAGSMPAVAKLEVLSDALDELSQKDAYLAELVDLKYFCGFSVAEIAALRATSERSVERDWEKARLLLFASLQDIVK